jgi:hypothetical protein
MTNHSFHDPKIIALKDFRIEGTTIEGTDVNNEVVKISVMKNGADTLNLLGYTDELDRVQKG